MTGEHEAGGSAVLLLLIVLTLGYALVARRLELVGITAPMVFVAAGILLGDAGIGLVPVDLDAPWILICAEVTLAVILFVDAARLRPRDVGGDRRPVLRLLVIGLPLTIVTGTLLNIAVFPGQGWVAAFLLGAILSPTDAALGSAVVSDRRVPERVRRILGVESGLNDGLATPVVTVALAVAAVQLAPGEGESWELGAVRSLSVAIVLGGALGWGGGWIVRWCRGRGWASPLSVQVAVLSLALLCYFGAIAFEGNGFVAAYVGGLALATSGDGDSRDEDLAFAETSGLLASYAVWLVFGAAMAGPALGRISGGVLLVALAALTVARMIPVAAALMRMGWSPPTVAFIGWFGPRGIATVIFTLVALETLGSIPPAVHVLDVASITVLVSIVAHGFSARPLAARYGSWVRTLPPTAPERLEVTPWTWRLGLHHR
jgi:sodium/hydrogen antiporter